MSLPEWSPDRSRNKLECLSQQANYTLVLYMLARSLPEWNPVHGRNKLECLSQQANSTLVQYMLVRRGTYLSGAQATYSTNHKYCDKQCKLPQRKVYSLGLHFVSVIISLL
jgi:hypothetical protein